MVGKKKKAHTNNGRGKSVLLVIALKFPRIVLNLGMSKVISQLSLPATFKCTILV